MLHGDSTITPARFSLPQVADWRRAVPAQLPVFVSTSRKLVCDKGTYHTSAVVVYFGEADVPGLLRTAQKRKLRQ